MGLMAPNLVVVKQRRAWRELATVARSQVTWAATRRLAREAYIGATRERAWSLLVSAWPLRWSWLIAWLLIDLAVWSSYLATSAVLPISRHDVIMFLLANLMGGAQLMRARAEGDKALADAASFKTAGSVALRKGKLDVAIEQYLEGEKCAAKLADMPSLNRAFAGRGAPAARRLPQQRLARAPQAAGMGGGSAAVRAHARARPRGAAGARQSPVPPRRRARKARRRGRGVRGPPDGPRARADGQRDRGDAHGAAVGWRAAARPRARRGGRVGGG